MRRHFFLILLFLSIKSISLCQSLPDSSATWTIASIGMGSYYANETLMIQEDTTINSFIYKSIYVTKDSIFDPIIAKYFCAVREVDHKWYFIPKNQTKEFMLYDFGVQKGDVVTINNPWCNGESQLNVFEIDSINLCGNYFRKIGIGYYDKPSGQPYIFDYWIEGIGSTMGLYLSGLNIMDTGNQLLCFHHNDSLIYLNSPNGSCGYIKVGIKTNLLKSEIKIFTNPVTNQLIIESNHDIFVEVYILCREKNHIF